MTGIPPATIEEQRAVYERRCRVAAVSVFWPAVAVYAHFQWLTREP